MIDNNETINADLKIWDARGETSRAAFDIYREGLCCAFMPWTPELKSGSAFEARLEVLPLDSGNIVNVVGTSPHTNVRNRSHIANSDEECYYLSYSFSNKSRFDQTGREAQASPGDVVIFDSNVPTVAYHDPCAAHVNAVGLSIPKQLLAHIPDANERFRNLLIPSAHIPLPLANSLWLLADRMLSAPTAEMQAIYSACVSLLPVAAGVWSQASESRIAMTRKRGLAFEIRQFVHRNLAQPSLDAKGVAAHFNISERYVYKLFAEAGTTFSMYVMLHRLQGARNDLESRSHAREPIYKLAYKWGFDDVTSFNRAFRRHFRCTPSSIRG